MVRPKEKLIVSTNGNCLMSRNQKIIILKYRSFNKSRKQPDEQNLRTNGRNGYKFKLIKNSLFAYNSQ